MPSQGLQAQSVQSPGRSSSEGWRQPSLASSGSTADSDLKVFAGKKVLLVEVCEMVRLALCFMLLTLWLRSVSHLCEVLANGLLVTL